MEILNGTNLEAEAEEKKQKLCIFAVCENHFTRMEILRHRREFFLMSRRRICHNKVWR